MQIAGLAAAASPAASGAANNRIGLADDFDSFLKLLTTQLKSQDPLAPMDAAQFTQQLVQFSGVEQAIKTNDTLGQLVALMRGDQIARSVDYLGAEVEARGDTIRLGADDPAPVHYALNRPAADVTINVRDTTGKVVFTASGEGEVGRHELRWDGRDAIGRRLPEGLYQVEVVAKDTAGATVPVDTTVSGTVDGVELSGDRLLLSVDGVLVPLDAITAIRRLTSDSSTL